MRKVSSILIAIKSVMVMLYIDREAPARLQTHRWRVEPPCLGQPVSSLRPSSETSAASHTAEMFNIAALRLHWHQFFSEGLISGSDMLWF